MAPTPRKPSGKDESKQPSAAKSPTKKSVTKPAPAATLEPVKPVVKKPTKHFSKVRLGVAAGILALVAILWAYENHAGQSRDSSLARLNRELTHRKEVLQSLGRTEIPTLLTGSVTVAAEPGTNTQTDYYTWHGLFRKFHIRVDSDHTGKVYNIESSLSGKTMSTPTSVASNPQAPLTADPLKPSSAVPVVPVFKPNLAPHAVTEEELIAALERAEELYEPQGNQTEEFRDVLRSVYDALPEAKTSTVKGELHWNSFKLSRRNSKLCAVRFQVPFAGPAELDYVQATKWVRINMGLGLGNMAAEKDYLQLANWLSDRGIISCGASGGFFGDMSVENRRTSDLEPFVKDIEGLTLPPENRLVFQSTTLEHSAPETRFILWYWTGGAVTWKNGQAFQDLAPDPSVDLELDSLVFVSPAGKSPLRMGAHEVCDFIGLRADIPTYPPTADGMRAALQALDSRIPRRLYSGTTIRRILNQVQPALPEFQVSATPGKAIWNKIEFPHGPLAALRGRIPDASGKKVELYGAVAVQGPSGFGWDHNGPEFGDFSYRRVQTGPLPELSITPQGLWVFSQPQGTVEPGHEFVFWIRSEGPPLSPAFVTLTVVSHDETQEGDEPLFANRYPWSSAKLAGVAIPGPVAPEGCVVLGWHERPMSQLMFTPDGGRLVSIDYLGDARIWNVESQQLEGTIKLPLRATENVLISPDSRTLLVLDNAKKNWNRWEIESRLPLPAFDSGLSQNGILRAVNFGAQPNQVVAMEQKNVTTLEHEHGFLTRDLPGNRTIQTSALARESLANTYHSLVYLPSLNLFATGVSRAVAPPSVKYNLVSTTSFVQLWHPDFTRPVREVLFGHHSQDRDEEGVLFSYHPNSQRLAALCGQRILKVWDINTWTELLSKSFFEKRNPNAPEGASIETNLIGLSLSADGETVATINLEGSSSSNLLGVPKHDQVDLWSVSKGVSRPAFQADKTPITQVTHSPDGRWVATANKMGVIRLWKNMP